MEDWQGLRVYVVIPPFVVSSLLCCTSSVPTNSPEQTVSYNHLKSNIEEIKQESQEQQDMSSGI